MWINLYIYIYYILVYIYISYIYNKHQVTYQKFIVLGWWTSPITTYLQLPRSLELSPSVVDAAFLGSSVFLRSSACFDALRLGVPNEVRVWRSRMVLKMFDVVKAIINLPMMMFAINLWSYGGMLYYWAYQIRSEIWKKKSIHCFRTEKIPLKMAVGTLFSGTSTPIGSMVLVYMLTWLGYIDGIHVTIYRIHGSYGT